MPNHTASSEAQEHLSYISLATDGHRHAFKSSLLWWENANAFSRRGWSLHSLSQEGEVSPTKEDALWFLIFCLLDRYLRPWKSWHRGRLHLGTQSPCSVGDVEPRRRLDSSPVHSAPQSRPRALQQWQIPVSQEWCGHPLPPRPVPTVTKSSLEYHQAAQSGAIVCTKYFLSEPRVCKQ